MSGFEVVGVLLGAIPLVISTLEHYRDGVRTISRWRKFDRELQSLIRNLETERVKLQNVCEKLLIGLVPPSRIEAMVGNPLGDLWLEKETQKKIQTRLWNSWGVFRETVAAVNTAINEMVKRLGDGASMSWANGSLIAMQLKRANFTLSRSSYADLLTAIRDGVANLESLATSNIELEPGRRVRSQVKLFSILREVSASIHRAISSSLVCPCKHAVNLRLSRWTADISPGDEEEDIVRELKFHLALSYVPGAQSTPPPSTGEEQLWEEVRVETARPPAPPAVPPLLSNPSLDIAGSKPKVAKKSGKGVRFAAFQPTSSASETPPARLPSSATTLVTTAMSTLAVGMTTSDFKDLDTAVDLCKKIGRTRSEQAAECYGIIPDRLCKRKRCYVVHHPVSTTTTGENRGAGKMVSLRDILEGGRGLEPMTYRDRLQLAVFVTSSVLQLYKTPWLSEMPTSRDIFFLRGDGSPSYGRVFVMAGSGVSGVSAPAFPMIRNPTLLALGILLIEIIRGQTIDSLRSPNEAFGVGGGLLADYVTARRLLNEVYQASSNYGSAVRRCIDGEFERQSLDLDDVDFQQEVYSRVVALLEEDLRHT